MLLINPPSPEQLGSPLLGLQYVAAALLRRGHEVRVIDAAARYFDRDADSIVGEAESFDPDVIGFSLFTRWIWHAYQLVERFQNDSRLLVAGGAHATVRPEETLQHGFDVAVVGEAEHTIAALVDAVEKKQPLEFVSGVVTQGLDGSFRWGPTAPMVQDLDEFPFPMEAQHLFDAGWYSPSGEEVIPGGILTSRGCPARCTFCANYVTGRTFRYRSAENVVAELNAYHRKYGINFLPCWDDALTANHRRLYELCDQLIHKLTFNFSWSAITRANMVTPDLLRAMKQAGLVHVNFGVESGDDEVLKQIKKGFTTEHVVRALEWAKEEGLGTACNFMLGFPGESPRALERTLEFMQRISPMVDSFSTLGVVVPFPGTPIYEDNHQQYGFTDWWLREDHSHYTAPPPASDFDRFYRHYIDDSNLELDFFHYSEAHRDWIRTCMKFKGEHNLQKMGLLSDPVFRPMPNESLHSSGM